MALTPADFDFKKGNLSITTSYQRLKGKDVITDPKTPKRVRVVKTPPFLIEEMFFRLVKQTAEREGVNAQPKADNQMEWVARMNSIRSSAAGIVNNDIIYN